MKSISFTKYQTRNFLKDGVLFYLILSLAISLLVIIKSSTGANIVMEGMDFISIIFVFAIVGDEFQKSFYFSKSMGVSRKSFFNGYLISIGLLSIFVSFIDLLINRIQSIFMNSPLLFDVVYRTPRYLGEGDNILPNAILPSYNQVGVFLDTFIYKVAVCVFIGVFSMFFMLLFYRSNKLVKTLITISFILTVVVLPGSMYEILGEEKCSSILLSLGGMFGITTQSPYKAVLAFIALSVAFAIFSYMLIKKAVIKDRK